MTSKKYKELKGINKKKNFKKPYVPNFNKIPASKTEPAVGAST
jgi:hypothetical protein